MSDQEQTAGYRNAASKKLKDENDIVEIKKLIEMHKKATREFVLASEFHSKASKMLTDGDELLASKYFVLSLAHSYSGTAIQKELLSYLSHANQGHKE